jgi:hypothetical protein
MGCGASMPGTAAGGVLEGEVAGGPFDASGTWTIALHCGHDARFPAAEAATFSVRPQLVQGNSMFPVEEGEEKVVDILDGWKSLRSLAHDSASPTASRAGKQPSVTQRLSVRMDQRHESLFRCVGASVDDISGALGQGPGRDFTLRPIFP